MAAEVRGSTDRQQLTHDSRRNYAGITAAETQFIDQLPSEVRTTQILSLTAYCCINATIRLTASAVTANSSEFCRITEQQPGAKPLTACVCHAVVINTHLTNMQFNLAVTFFHRENAATQDTRGTWLCSLDKRQLVRQLSAGQQLFLLQERQSIHLGRTRRTIHHTCRNVLFHSLVRLLSPPSGRTVTIVLPGPSFRASLSQ